MQHDEFLFSMLPMLLMFHLIGIALTGLMGLLLVATLLAVPASRRWLGQVIELAKIGVLLVVAIVVVLATSWIVLDQKSVDRPVPPCLIC